MKKILSVIMTVMMVFALAACGPKVEEVTVAPTIDAKDAVASYLAAVDEQFAYDVTYTLSYDEELTSKAHGWRTAGSEEEHKAADYLAGKMEEIGLTDVEKVEVPVDLWQFNDASLTVDGTDINIMPASYASQGTDAEGITAKLVDVGTGTAAEYAEVDVKGKIAVVGVDQWNEAWIDQYLDEAGLQGAAALVTYDVDGYATYSDDVINMQDICTGCDIMPCVSISKNDYKALKKAMKAGNATATLKVDNTITENGGTGYNVVGKIKGKSSDQQIIVAGHYDKYFYGFQDDCAAVGLFMGMAKGMIDSGYVPENDILFVAHCAEEWGTVNSQFDWAIGSWEMINTAHPEWAEKTIAMLNFELPAYYDGAEKHQIACVPEFDSLVAKLAADSAIVAAPTGDGTVFPEGVDTVAEHTGSWDDTISYRFAGVPAFSNVGGSRSGADGWRQQRYHTAADDKDTYNADVMHTNLDTFGAIAIYVDQTPAVELDFTATCDMLEDILDEDVSAAAGADADAYKAALAQLRSAAEALNGKIAEINSRYDELVAGNEDGANEEAIAELRAEAKAQNKKTLEIFKYVQDNFINLILTTDVATGHEFNQNNVYAIQGVLDALDKGELWTDDETGALDYAWQIDGENEYGYYLFSPATTERVLDALLEERNPGNLFWGTGKASELAGTSEATISLLEKSEAEDEGANADYSKEIGIYEEALARQLAAVKDRMAVETEKIAELASAIEEHLAESTAE